MARELNKIFKYRIIDIINYMELIKFWNELEFNQNPFVHPDDKIDLETNYTNINCYDDHIKKNLDFINDDSKYHLNLIPIPYIGNIKKAKIFILMLNPGFGRLDYYAESNDKELKEALINNLHQENLNPEYPFIYLNPKFLWHGGGQYYENRFKELIKKAEGKTYAKKLSRVAIKVAVLQLVPYHSKSNNVIKNLDSSNKIKNFVKNELLQKAEKEICIISVRGVKRWGLNKNIHKTVIYSKHPRLGHISKNIFPEDFSKIVAKLNEPF